MVDCVDILRSITKSCGDNVGGVNKRVWITQLQQIENYTFDSLGYVNSLVTKENGNTNYPYELKKVISKKGSHSGNVEAIENVNIDVFKHTAILKAYATTPEQRDSLVSLYGASKVVVFFETDNGDIEIYGLENGLYATALTGNTGEQMQDDTAFTFTLSGLQTSLPKYFLYGGSLHTSIAYLDNIGLTPIYEIESYTAGTSTIDFINNGGDDWTIGLKLNPDSQQLPIGYSIDSYDYFIDFWNGSGRTPLYGGTAITAPTTTLNTSGNGAGTYSMQVIYNATNGIDTKTFSIWNLIEVDASGNVVDYVKMDGMTVNSVSGLTMSVTANITQSQSYPITWVTSPTYAEIGTGVSPTLTLNVDADVLGYGVTLGPEFPDFTSAFGVESSVTIN